LVLASARAGQGVNCPLAERNTHTALFPKIDVTNVVSMELLRRSGAFVELRRVGVAPRHSFHVIFAPGLYGAEITRLSKPLIDEGHR
jgi:hypothetical protein